ncbi:hypothetical protein B0H13DRAFT_1870502 [Mycena leptocephala]|nr:hypothetical protein B0H13DRAFT_1870502 [Mycena leptocephala]
MRSTYITFAAALASITAASPIPSGPTIPIYAIYEPRAVSYPPTAGDCIANLKYIGFYGSTANYSPACAAITRNCLAENGTSVWSHPACVAAATCQGIYGNMVGACATSGCPITQQNYIDFVYGQMTAAGVTEWPSSSDYVITNWWKPILAWTATGASNPYANFNDWLHWSNTDKWNVTCNDLTAATSVRKLSGRCTGTTSWSNEHDVTAYWDYQPGRELGTMSPVNLFTGSNFSLYNGMADIATFHWNAHSHAEQRHQCRDCRDRQDKTATN